jgi:NAD(P)-dependent dehydrogenase (short-subunit alcohol dehydrogenase family)
MAGVMVVTGGSRGIGAACARVAAREGFAVCVNAVANIAAARQVADEIARAGGKAIAVQADVRDLAAVQRLFAEVDRALGPVTALIANAGIVGRRQDWLGLDPALLRDVIATNLEGTVWCATEAARRMARSKGGAGGAIVCISSTAARFGGVPGWGIYAVSKAAVDCFVANAAKEWGPEGIRVVGVRPGPTETDMLEIIGGKQFVETVKATISLGRAGKPEEIAEAAVWLASPKASFVHGAMLDVGGGR